MRTNAQTRHAPLACTNALPERGALCVQRASAQVCSEQSPRPNPLPPDVLELATLLRETFGPLRISGRLVGKPDPEWTRWPSHTAADMAPAAWRAPGRREAQARCLADALTAAAVQP